MFCIKCGQQLPEDAHFCSQCGAKITKTSIVTDTVAAKAEDIVISDDQPIFARDKVSKEAELFGDFGSPYEPTVHSSLAQQARITKELYPKISKTTFFGGELTLVKTEYSKDDFSYELHGVNLTSEKYSYIYQTSVDDCIFIAYTIGDKQELFLRWDYKQHLIVQDISESFTHIKAPFPNYFEVEKNGKIGYVCFDAELKRLRYVIECKYPSISVDNYFDNKFLIFKVDNCCVVCYANLYQEEYYAFMKITDNVFKAQKGCEQSYILLQWDSTQKKLINPLPSHHFEEISNQLNLSYIKVRENGKYGYAQVSDNGACDLKIPCIFDNTGSWGRSAHGFFLDGEPEFVAPVEYNGKAYCIDSHMQFYETSRISRLGRAASDIIGVMMISTSLIIIAIILWFLIGKGYLGNVYIEEEIFASTAASIYLICSFLVIISYFYHTNPVYVKKNILTKTALKSPSQDYNKLKKYMISYISILCISFCVFMYEAYVFNWKYDEYASVIESFENKGIVFPAKKNNKWGYVDFVGREIIPFQYIYADEFNRSTRIARVCMGGINTASKHGDLKHNGGGRWGCINISGEVIIPIEYDEIHLIRKSNLIFVKVKDKWGVFNKDGREITPAIWDNLLSNLDIYQEDYSLSNGSQRITINQKGERIK